MQLENGYSTVISCKRKHNLLVFLERVPEDSCCSFFRGLSQMLMWRGKARRRLSMLTSTSRMFWRRNWRMTVSTSTRGKRQMQSKFSSIARLKKFYVRKNWLCNGFSLPAGDGSLSHQCGAHLRVLREALCHQQSFHGQWEVSSSAEHHAEQQPSASPSREEVSLETLGIEDKLMWWKSNTDQHQNTQKLHIIHTYNLN